MEYRAEVAAETVRIEEAEPPDIRMIDEGLRDTWGPDGETAAVRFTLPEKLFTLVSVIEVVPDEPWTTVRDVGLELIEKSGLVTVTLTVVVCEGDPELFVPVTVMLYDPGEVV